MIKQFIWLFAPWSLAFLFLGRFRTCPQVLNNLKNINLINNNQNNFIKVSIIIPARNEQQRLPILIKSLKTQTNILFKSEIIVVDDHSTDATAQIACNSEVTLIKLNNQLKSDWLGKPYACWIGAQHAKGEILLFLDADTECAPNSINILMNTYQKYQGLVSVQPYHKMLKFYERLSAFFFIIMMGSIRSFTIFGSRVNANGCFGPCILCARALYFQIGGHQLVKNEIIDDVALAREFKQRGVKINNFIGYQTISFRMYPQGLNELIEGWTKNLAQGFTNTDFILLFFTIAWISGGVATIDALRGCLITGWSPWVIAGIASYCAYTLQLWWLLKKLGNYGLITAITYPISLTFFVFIFIRSLYFTWICGYVRWKGRIINLSKSKNK